MFFGMYYHVFFLEYNPNTIVLYMNMVIKQLHCILYINTSWYYHLIPSPYHTTNIFQHNAFVFSRAESCCVRRSCVLSSAHIRCAIGTVVRYVMAVCLKGRGTETHRRSTTPRTPASAACVIVALLHALWLPVLWFPARTPSPHRDIAAHSAEVSVFPHM